MEPLRDLIVYLRDISSCGVWNVGSILTFVGHLWTLELVWWFRSTCWAANHNAYQMQASRPLASGAADADSTGSSYRRSILPVTRATVTSDTIICILTCEQDQEQDGHEAEIQVGARCSYRVGPLQYELRSVICHGTERSEDQITFGSDLSLGGSGPC